MKNLTYLIFLTALTVFFTGCATTDSGNQVSSLPEWVSSPYVEGGFASTQCVENNASMSVLKTKAAALARADIAKEISLNVNAMDKTFLSLSESVDGQAEGSSFESVSKQVTSQRLSGSRQARTDFVKFPNGIDQLCVMVTLDPEKTKGLYDDIVGTSGRRVSAQTDSILWQEFKAHKAQQELDADLEKAR